MKSRQIYIIWADLCNLDSLGKIPTVSRHGGKLSEVEIGGPHHFTSQMSDQGPFRMGQPRQSHPVSSTMEQYLQRERERLKSSRGRTGTGRETRHFWTAMSQVYSRIQSLNIINMTQTLFYAVRFRHWSLPATIRCYRGRDNRPDTR
jgi:hypothetical protein